MANIKKNFRPFNLKVSSFFSDLWSKIKFGKSIKLHYLIIENTNIFIFVFYIHIYLYKCNAMFFGIAYNKI